MPIRKKMDKIYVLGTGNAVVTKCYNTCFVLELDGQRILVDGGGGIGILKALEDTDIDINSIKNIFVSHKHTDHILGIVWVIRVIGKKLWKKEGILNIYCHDECADIIKNICSMILPKKTSDLFGTKIIFHILNHGEKRMICEREFTFFDIFSHKAKQFGFNVKLYDNSKLVFLGDEPLNDKCLSYAENPKWLLSEAMCLYSQRDIFNPYEISHATVKEACCNAKRLKAQNLLLWHTVDNNIEKREENYIKEGKSFFEGKIFVPNDNQIIEL